MSRYPRSIAAISNDSYVAAAIGLAYQNPHTAFWTSHADLQIGRAETEFDDRFDFAEASAGLTYRPSRETRIRGTLGWRSEDWDFFEATMTGLRLEALHTFDTGLDYLPPPLGGARLGIVADRGGRFRRIHRQVRRNRLWRGLARLRHAEFLCGGARRTIEPR